MRRRILVVDDMELNRDHLKKVLEGYEVETACDGRSALERLQAETFHLVITDLRMPDMSGFELLSSVRADRVPVGVIVLTAYGDTTDALRTMKAGADDYLTKPYDADHLRFLVKRTLERRRLIDELSELRNQLGEEYSFHTLVSKSARMRRIFDLIRQVGPLRSTVLINGETGTGKELVAQAIHAADPRRGPFVALELRGAQRRAARERALRPRERGVHRGGTAQGRPVRARRRRHLAARRGRRRRPRDAGEAVAGPPVRDLREGRGDRIDQGRRADRGGHAQAPGRRGQGGPVPPRPVLSPERDPPRAAPLRERTEDIALLATHFLEKYRSVRTTPVTEIDAEAMQALLHYQWPGNVRELENAIKSAIAFAEGSVLHRENLPESISPRLAGRGAGSSLIDIDRRLPELTDDLIGQVERDYFVAAPLRVLTATSPAAPATAACRAGASPRSSRSTASSASTSNGGRNGSRRRSGRAGPDRLFCSRSSGRLSTLLLRG